jgi:hypothetical protein
MLFRYWGFAPLPVLLIGRSVMTLLPRMLLPWMLLPWMLLPWMLLPWVVLPIFDRHLITLIPLSSFAFCVYRVYRHAAVLRGSSQLEMTAVERVFAARAFAGMHDSSS